MSGLVTIYIEHTRVPLPGLLLASRSLQTRLLPVKLPVLCVQPLNLGGSQRHID